MTISSQWPVLTNVSGTCFHGTPFGVSCWLCLNATGGNWTFSPPPTFGGWQCVCGRAYSPQVLQCPHCGPEAAPEPGTGTAQPPHRLTAAASCPCQPSAEGGMCGCEEDSDAPAGPCKSFRCSC